MDKRVIGFTLLMFLIGAGGVLFRMSMGLGPFDSAKTIAFKDPKMLFSIMMLMVGIMAVLCVIIVVLHARIGKERRTEYGERGDNERDLCDDRPHRRDDRP